MPERKKILKLMRFIWVIMIGLYVGVLVGDLVGLMIFDLLHPGPLTVEVASQKVIWRTTSSIIMAVVFALLTVKIRKPGKET